MKRYLILHPFRGIYVGCALGMGFWTLLDSSGQSRVVTFKTKQEARKHIKDAFLEGALGCLVLPVEAISEYASIQELKKSGYADQLGNMEIEYLMYAEPAGFA